MSVLPPWIVPSSLPPSWRCSDTPRGAAKAFAGANHNTEAFAHPERSIDADDSDGSEHSAPTTLPVPNATPAPGSEESTKAHTGSEVSNYARTGSENSIDAHAGYMDISDDPELYAIRHTHY